MTVDYLSLDEPILFQWFETLIMRNKGVPAPFNPRVSDRNQDFPDTRYNGFRCAG